MGDGLDDKVSNIDKRLFAVETLTKDQIEQLREESTKKWGEINFLKKDLIDRTSINRNDIVNLGNELRAYVIKVLTYTLGVVGALIGIIKFIWEVAK